MKRLLVAAWIVAIGTGIAYAETCYTNCYWLGDTQYCTTSCY